MVFDVWTRGIAEAVTRALVALFEEFGHFGCVLVGDSEFFADAFVPHFGEGFGGFDRETVEQKVFGVIVVFEKFGGMFGCTSSHCYEVKRARNIVRILSDRIPVVLKQRNRRGKGFCFRVALMADAGM